MKTINISRVGAALTLLATVFAAPAAFAQEGESRLLNAPQRANTMAEQKPSIGIRTGLADTEGGTDSAWEYGVEAGYQPWIPVSVALELSGYSLKGDGQEAGITRTKLLGKAHYNFGGTIPVIRYSYVGAGLGPVYDNVNNDQDWNLGLAPTAGFDIPLNRAADRVSLGANLAYLIVSGDNPDAFSANGVMKYWF